MTDALSANLARNIRKIREARGLTQEGLAKLSGLPRPTWANLESGSANPTLTVLTKVSATLMVSLQELIGPPREEVQFFAAESIPVKSRGSAIIRKMLPEELPGVEFDRVELPPGARMAGVPHRNGTREYLTCESGEIELRLAGEVFLVRPGDVVVFRGDQRHGYANPGKRPAVGYSVVLLSL